MIIPRERGVSEELAPFLPGHAVVDGVNPAQGKGKTIGQISAAPWGSASVLPISWTYIAMCGEEGLKRSSSVAILNANYIAKRLHEHFPVVYTGTNGFVAHECIIDLRGFKESCGISVEDVAKRLIDYGFHAPTMSWPVAETMMVEPTESESQKELDRFCDAMISIRGEIAEVEAGKISAEDSVVRHAPHVHQLLLEDWTAKYSKQQAFFPLPYVRGDKFWPPVSRIDNAWGDRNLVCTCPPLENLVED